MRCWNDRMWSHRTCWLVTRWAECWYACMPMNIRIKWRAWCWLTLRTPEAIQRLGRRTEKLTNGIFRLMQWLGASGILALVPRLFTRQMSIMAAEED